MTLLVLGSIVKGPRGPVIDMALIACANLSLSSMFPDSVSIALIIILAES